MPRVPHLPNGDPKPVPLSAISDKAVYVSWNQANAGRYTPGQVVDHVHRLDITTRGREQDVDRGIALLGEGTQSVVRGVTCTF